LPDSYDRLRVVVSKPKTGNAWMGDLTRGEKGPHATVSNAVIVLGCDEALAETVAYDEFAHRVVVTVPPPVAFLGATEAPGPYPRTVTDTDVTLIQGYIQRVYDMRISQQVALQAILAVAEFRRIHPVREWLDGLEWDGVRRVDTWLHNAFGSPDDAYHVAVGAKVLAAAVRRVRRPGTKFDHVLVLEGKQGKGKSRACAALFGQEWFTDNLSHDLASKDAQQGMAGKWGIELAELNVLVRSTSQAAKAFFSRQVDYYRPPYGKSFVEQPRQSIFIGTTNDADYLTDSTGNRRYWPVFCEKAEVGWISDNREQLWAEAAEIEARGEVLWLEDGTLQRKAVLQQSQRLAEDVWTSAVRKWIEEGLRSDVQVGEVLHHALGLPRAQQNRAAEMRVASILRADGWMRHKHRGRDGKPTSSWFAPGRELPGRPGVKVPLLDPEDDDETS
jgi:predicted P-loop ATPase